MEGRKELNAGSRVRVTLEDGLQFEGLVFCHSVEDGLLVLEEGDDRDREHHDMRFVTCKSIKSCEEIEAAPKNIDLSLPSISQKAILEKEKRAMKREEENLKRIGAHASPEEQQMFDRLFKLYGSEWRGTSIYLPSIDVTIRGPPYTSDTCSGSDATALARIKKIVSNIIAEQKM